MSTRRLPITLLAFAIGAGAAVPGCGGNKPASAGAAGPGAAAVPVSVEVVAPKPVERISDYIATLKSRRSSEIRPQVEGIITKIFVRSGDRVGAGTPLVQVEASKQQATLASDEASRAAQAAALEYAKQEYDRQQKLFAAGLVSRQALDEAKSRADTAEASLKALAAQVQESQVQLQYYRVSAPTAGIVGDIPVRVGDRVTTSTVLTTIDQNTNLEAYIYVPVERSPDLKMGLPVRLVTDRGEVLAETAIDFISPQVDNQTQAVLVKAPVPQGRGFRNDQFVHTLVVWSSTPAITVPVLAVTRVNGQFFAYVAENGKQGAVAKQRLLKLGPVTGNDYVVLEGLKPGERVVTSGVQKIGDGAPIAPSAS
jgi:RND family efflux transporter MFP subunit